MHSFDSLARTLVGPPPRAARPLQPRRERQPILPHLISVTCALLPLTVMVQAYLLTA